MNQEIIKAATGQIQIQSEQKWTPSKIGKDVTMLQKSIAAPKFEFLEEKDIRSAIKYSMLMVGLKQIEIDAFSEIEKQLFVNFLKNHFSSLTIEEYKNAFELAILGKLPLKVEDVNCYQNFSIAYVSKILSAYREWANKTYNDNRHVLEKPIELPKALMPSIDWKEYCELSYQQFKKGNYNTDTWAINSMYKEFLNVGYIAKNLIEDYEASAQCTLLKKLENKLFDAKLRGDVNEANKLSSLIAEIHNSEETHEAVKVEAKLAVIIEFFNYAYNKANLENIYQKQ